jgi:hypothetical protein
MGNWTLAIAGWAVCAMLLTGPSRAEGLPLDGFEDAIHHWQMKRGEDYPHRGSWLRAQGHCWHAARGLAKAVC